MTRLRFETVRDVIEAFPVVERLILGLLQASSAAHAA